MQVYFNDPQRLTQLIGANTTVIVAGRRTGKTDSIASPFVLRNMQRMPGSTGGIVVPTFKHGLTNTIPGLLAAFRRWGYRDGIHYVVGRKPPQAFREAIIEPQEYEHVISFYNGSRAVLISQDRPGSSNSLTLSWLLIDEAKFIDYEKLKDETLPANGGSRVHFGTHSYNHSIMILSDMPVGKRGSWFLNYKQKMDTELIDTIKATVAEIYKQKQRYRQYIAQSKTPPAYLKKHIRNLDRQLNRMRSVAVYYKEYSTIENLQLLGENYIKQMKRDLTPLTFQTSILCKPVGIAKDGFYSSMREKHIYNASDFTALDQIWHDTLVAAQAGAQAGAQTAKIGCLNQLNSTADADIDPDQPICIGMDYNANINWIVAGQPREDRLLVLKSFYVKYERKLPALVHDFCTYYTNHRCRKVVFYYDTTALGSNYAVNTQDFHYVICHEFEQHGWTVNSVFLGNPMKHHEKYLLINQAFQGKQRLMPYINRQNNDDLLLALRTAGVVHGRNGWRKNKGGEKLAEKEEDLLEHRTDGTDAFDTLYIGCEKFPQQTLSYLALTGIM